LQKPPPEGEQAIATVFFKGVLEKQAGPPSKKAGKKRS